MRVSTSTVVFLGMTALFTAGRTRAQDVGPSTEPTGVPEGEADVPLHRLDPRTPKGLQALLAHAQEPLPFVSAHRGGPTSGFPENCLATFEHTLAHTYALVEVDPRYTQDGEIVLFHDADLARTSTGRGRVAEKSLAELRELKLRDPEGKPTEHRIPTLDEALEWARGRTILVLDQKDVPIEARVKKVAEHAAEGHAILIAYSFEDVRTCYGLNPNIVMEVMIPNREQVAAFDRLGVPWRNVVAFVGHTPPEDAGLYDLIHERGACCMVGTSRNLDRRILTGQAKEIASLEADYRALLNRGADLFETDIPVPLGPLLYHATPVPASKKAYFRVK